MRAHVCGAGLHHRILTGGNLGVAWLAARESSSRGDTQGNEYRER